MITISIVTGTYKRLPTLKRMVQSVRDTLIETVPYEFIIADNDSQDGTYEWISSQADVKAIQLGKPVGAIQAFTQASKLATGDYVLLATDDIHFPSLAILRALRHLEETPTCGAVAFAHNKSGNFQVDRQKAQTLDGQPTSFIYPQITLVRRWLGDLCGWWGGDHNHMKKSFTYGGDNYLGSRIVEYGYTVDAVDGCNDLEDTIADVSRGLSSTRHQSDFDNYWSLYPDGPTIQTESQVPNPQKEQLRVLLCLHYEPRFPQHKKGKVGMDISLRKLGHVWSYDYEMSHSQGRNVTEDLQRIAEAWQPHVLWTQVHNPISHHLPYEALERIRMVSPKTFCINWNGDYWVSNIEKPETQSMYRLFDLILVQTVYLVERLCELDICAVFLAHTFEPATPVVDAPGYDVVFQGNGYTEEREQIIQLIAELPYTHGLYGRCRATPMDGDTHYDFALSQGIYRNSKIAISPMEFDYHTARGFVSNRMWEILASGGAICLQQYVPMLTELTGITDGEHVVYWNNFHDLRVKIDYYMTHPDEAEMIAQKGYDFVHQYHNYDTLNRYVLTEVLEQWQFVQD